MKIINLTALLTACLIATAPVPAADHNGHAATSSEKTGVSGIKGEAKPKLTLYPVRTDVLQDGYVYLPFRVENMLILPIYPETNGVDTTKSDPMIGHLHVMVDNNGWNWIHASTDPIYFGPLSPGNHEVKIELVDAAHQIIEVQTVKLAVPSPK